MILLAHFIIGFLLFFVERGFTLYLVARGVEAHEQFEDFLKGMLNLIYANVIVVFATWLIVPESSMYVVVYGLLTMITLLRIDLDDLEENYLDMRTHIIGHNS